MVDAVKVIADGIRLEKKIVKSAEKHDYRSKIRGASHDATNIGKDDSTILINATSGGADKSAEKETDTANTADDSASRTEKAAEQTTETNTEKESDN